MAAAVDRNRFRHNKNIQLMTIDTTFIAILSMAVITAVVIIFTRACRFQGFVHEGYAGLLYHEGKLVATLPAGRHVRYGRNYRLGLVDTRKTLLQVPGQEVLTADNVGVKVSIVLTVQIVDAAKSVQAVDHHVTHLYSAAQTAVRAIVVGVTMETLLGQRVAIGPQLRELISAQAEAVGVQVHTVEVRDVMLPGELRKAFSEALKARQEGQATLERARSESAALRNLANAARLLDGHPALATLRFLQALETSRAGQTFVMNDLSALIPALRARSNGATGAAPEET